MPRRKPSSSRHAVPWNICIPITCRSGPWLSGRWDLPITSREIWPKAGRAYTEAYSLAQAAGNIVDSSLASIRLGQVQEAENQLHLAAETYQGVLPLIDEYSPHNAPLAYLGLARIYYEWNDLDAAEQYGEKSFQLARQYDQVVDRLIQSELFLARLHLVRKDAVGAAHILSLAEQTSRQRIHRRLPDVASTRNVPASRWQRGCGRSTGTKICLPVMQARVLIAQRDPSEALAVLEPQRQQAEVKRSPQRLLLVMAVQSVVLFAQGEKDQAVQVLTEALALAEPGGYIRLFVDEGDAMAELLSAAAAQGIRPDYVGKLLAAFKGEMKDEQPTASVPGSSFLIEPLS